MSDNEGIRLMCRLWWWTTCVMAGITALLAALLVTGVVDSRPATGSAMGFLAVLVVVSAGCWTHWRGKVSER